MTLLEKLTKGQNQAPSYAIVLPDGAPYTCYDCKKKVNSLVKTWTPDGINRRVTCIDCLDPEWLEMATKLDFTL